MKNAMKKLLCMALAIMLLVSAVPMFAAADGEITGDASYQVFIDGNPRSSGTINLTDSIKTGLDALRVVNPDYVLDYNFTGFYVNEVAQSGTAEDVITNGCRLRFELTTKPAEQCTVHLVLDGVDRSFQVNKGSSQRLDTALVRSLNFNIPGGYIVKQFTLSDGSRLYDEGSSVVVDYNMTFNVVLAPDSSSSDDNDGGTGDNTGNGNNNNNNNSGSGSGTVSTFKAIFLNVNGMQAYSESVASNGKVGISASELNRLVGSKDGYEHIGWKSSFGTQTTSEVVRNNITANVTYTPVFQNLTNNTTWTPSSGTGSSGSSGSSGTTGSSNTPNYSEVPGNVYLEIYTNKNFGSYDARFSITNNSNKNYNIGTDGVVSAERGGDLWNLMASIYTAKDSNGMEVKLYQFEGNNFPVDWAFGNYYTSISNLTAARQNKDITIRVVVNNVYRKTADTSNPKTGDPIMMSVAVLGITACGLAAAYIYSKKRKAV